MGGGGFYIPDPPDSCEECGAGSWNLSKHPASQKMVCYECRHKPSAGWVPCPYTANRDHDPKTCVACKGHKGFVEELKP